jgi:hypothetical protein
MTELLFPYSYMPIFSLRSCEDADYEYSHKHTHTHNLSHTIPHKQRHEFKTWDTKGQYKANNGVTTHWPHVQKLQSSQIGAEGEGNWLNDFTRTHCTSDSTFQILRTNFINYMGISGTPISAIWLFTLPLNVNHYSSDTNTILDHLLATDSCLTTFNACFMFPRLKEHLWDSSVHRSAIRKLCCLDS